jgi:hypothetical protein
MSKKYFPESEESDYYFGDSCLGGCIGIAIVVIAIAILIHLA